jgi:hypothetical protein
MLVKSLSFSLIPQIQPIYRSTFENIQGIENCMVNEVFYRAVSSIVHKGVLTKEKLIEIIKSVHQANYK